MIANIFRWTFFAFLIVMTLVVGGAWYQAVSIVPFWQEDIIMFKNYDHWGINYFPILSPLMTVLWLILVVTGFKVQMESKRILYIGHFFYLVVMLSTFIYFAPFLLTHMGHPVNLSDVELSSQLETWAKWDLVRQTIGLIPLAIFFYSYGKIGTIETTNNKKAVAH